MTALFVCTMLVYKRTREPREKKKKRKKQPQRCTNRPVLAPHIFHVPTLNVNTVIKPSEPALLRMEVKRERARMHLHTPSKKDAVERTDEKSGSGVFSLL